VGRERLDGLGSVVLAAVEAPVNRLLDAAAGGLEQGRYGQGGAGDSKVGPILAEHLAEYEHRADVAKPEDRGKQAVDQRAG